MNVTIKSAGFEYDKALQGIISGYASVFGNVDSDGDIMEKGCYTKTLQENSQRVKFLWQHMMDKPLGAVKEMEQDDNGLYIEAKISDTSLGRDAKVLIKDGAINEFSVGFAPIKYDERVDEKGNFAGYDMKEVKLYEFSLVSIAANPAAVMTDFKSEEKVDYLFKELDRIIALNKKVKSDEAKHIMDFELRKYKDILDSFGKSQKIALKKDRAEVDATMLDEIDKKLRDFKF